MLMVFVHELVDLYTFEGDLAHNSNVGDLLFYVHWLYSEVGSYVELLEERK